MNYKKNTVRIFALGLSILLSSTCWAETLVFDGLTNTDWNLVVGADGSEAHELTPMEDFQGTGLNGLEFNDLTGGVMYYSAAPSVFENGLSGRALDFEYQLNSAHPGGPFTDPIKNAPEVYVNGTPIEGLDIIDESIMDQLQSVRIDFSDTAFDGVNLNNVSSLYIKAEWWGDDVNPSVESYILGNPVPEPGAVSLTLASLIGITLLFRRRRGADEEPTRSRRGDEPTRR